MTENALKQQDNIHLYVSELERELDNLSQTIDQLENKLGPILIPENGSPTEDKLKEASEIPQSEIRSELRRSVTRVNDLRNVIENVTERVDLND